METLTLLPCIEGIRVESIANMLNSIVLHLSAMAPSARCPLCSSLAQRIHSPYQRMLADLPWNRVAVRIHLKARKFYCDNPACSRHIFTEPIPELAARYARKTNRLQHALYLIGYALGGEAGAKVAVGLGLSVSPDTLLRLIRQANSSVSPPSNVKVLGVDDFAFRKGQRYGTILVDLERRRLLDLLPDRNADTLANWLKVHPETEVVSRDRASVYADGAAKGAPQAQQVADRFHLLHNLVEALQRLLLRHHSVLRVANKEVSASVVPPQEKSTERSATEESILSNRSTRPQQERQQRYDRRFARYEQVRDWHRQGVSLRQIARNLKMHRRTVRQMLQLTDLPERASPKPRSSQHSPFDACLRQRWKDGCHNAAQLYRELKERGFRGSQSALRRYLMSWREQLPAELGGRRGSKAGTPPVPVNFSVRTTAWLLLGYAKTKETREQSVNVAFLERLKTLSPAIGQAQEFAQAFFALVRERKGSDLTAWKEKVLQSDLLELKSFVRGLAADEAAVVAGITGDWTNGQTEGQVNRLKLIKRTMYGRAKFDLLRARVLPMAQAA